MTDLDRMHARADALYGEKSQLPSVPPGYVVEPPATPRQSELDEARALVVAFLRELPDVALTLTAFAVLLVRDAWRWLRQWKRTPQIG